MSAGDDDLERAVAEAADRPARIRACNALASRLAWTGRAKEALPHAQLANALLAPGDEPRLVAETVHALARCQFYLLDFMAALELLLDAARAYGEAGDARGQATALAGVGTCQLRLGAREEASATLLRALEAARALGFTTLEINALNSLASTLLAADRLDEAAARLDEGTALARRVDDRNLLTKLLLNRSLLQKKRADADGDAAVIADGIASAGEALALAQALANRYDEAFCLGQLGTMLRRSGQLDVASATLGRSLALAAELDEPHLQAEAQVELGRVALGADRFDAALAHTEAAWPLAERTRERELQGEVLSALSAVHERRGELAAALSTFKRYHALRERELEATRSQAARAAQLWLDFQRAEEETARLRATATAAVEAAQKDPLTGLLNRRGLDAGLAGLPFAAQSAVAIALIDIDHFKSINDRHSHAVGDRVLARVAAAIRQHARAGDLAVRLGGDEFALVLANAGADDGRRVADRLLVALAESAADGIPEVTVSIGVAACEPGGDFAAALAAADRALYAAKAGGRARVAGAG